MYTRTRWVKCLQCGGRAAELIQGGYKYLLYVACPNHPCVDENGFGFVDAEGKRVANLYLAMKRPESWFGPKRKAA